MSSLMLLFGGKVSAARGSLLGWRVGLKINWQWSWPFEAAIVCPCFRLNAHISDHILAALRSGWQDYWLLLSLAWRFWLVAALWYWSLAPSMFMNDTFPSA